MSNDGLSRSEFNELNDHLVSISRDHGGMSMPQAHGFFTAMMTLPPRKSLGSWIPAVFGESLATYTKDEANHVMGLMVRFHNQIGAELAAKSFEPLGHPEAEIMKAWCLGYLEGTSLSPVWQGEEHLIKALLPMGILAGEFNVPTEEANPEVLLEALPKHVAELYARCGTFRKQLMDDAPDFSKLGPNDRCPCGTGIKYKKCCGAPTVEAVPNFDDTDLELN